MTKRITGSTIGVSIACMLAALLALLSFSTEVSAWTATGKRWPDQPRSGCCANLQFQPLQSSDFSNQNNLAAIDNAYARWSHYNNNSINVAWFSTTYAPWVLNIDTFDAGVTWAGNTTIWFDANTLDIQGVTTILNNAMITNETIRQGAAVHEIGHQMGLGHSTVSCAIMATPAFALCGNTFPQLDDITGVNNLY